jgi:hypothetical protein
LSEGIFSIPNKVWQFERPWPFSSTRWNARKEALCMKNMAKADRPKSATAMLPLRPFRGSGKPVQTERKTCQQRRQQNHPYGESSFRPFGNPQNLLLLESLEEWPKVTAILASAGAP